ncbi:MULTISPECIES: quinoprotein dehydrogenase-associated SoxYZ-like carrier [Paracoccus]|uniref:quinoprotein dehydrogenase-associated SoxYZ-like carrier n=1 Tax=Paracoccus TaxID=265 RepID=UPI00091D8528|nr:MULTISPECIES: quinoprotein dehydrogenase-associated SoxYZ-like carrier [Paracoccus]MDK8872031.1 quinoprotein dehydrogenase-associated SoxYZ-like carrier [Paracoccus sp. SSJ]MDQ7775641.1 quinoprotein dehydrogenase-associated SoxYZ-like carrier [Paracoccus aminovorans]UFM65473.1 quinoprotein dehydrogenase-associated SoxYZ-like carrier [Paracoccus sp. MA]SFY43303.1 sulfur-oxidizing protein SoxY [Paracoccus pantotrophus]
MALLTDRLPGAASPPLLTGRTGPAAVGGDAFDSGMWPSHRQEFLGDPAAWRNDPAVAVLAPRAAEDSRHVPFLIDATAVAQPIRRIVVTIDYSPFPKAIVFRPGRALPLLGFGVKYEVGGALRASAETGAETGAGEWLVGAAYVSALGGGCSAPAAAHHRPDWQQGFGELRARLWAETGRLRLRLRHPQDTGLADGIPAHHLTELALLDAAGAEIAALELHEPLEENPALTFLLPPDLARGPVAIRARDNLGYAFAGRVEDAP